MTKRQFFNLPIDQLESLFDQKRNDQDVLTSLIAELSHRKVARAKKLQQRVLQALSVKEKKPLQDLSENEIDGGPALLTVEEHRHVARHLRQGNTDGTVEERTMALEFAKHHEFLAKLIESRSTRST